MSVVDPISSALREQQELLPTEPFLQSYKLFFFFEVLFNDMENKMFTSTIKNYFLSQMLMCMSACLHMCAWTCLFQERLIHI